MKIREPIYVWTPYMKKKGEILPVKEKYRASFGSFPLFGLDESAPDDVKAEYERYVNIRLIGLARFFVPDMEAPYYTLEGEIVERSSLRNRELPLFEIRT